MSIIITGSTKGIGNALAHQFAAEGHDLITVARSQSDLDFQSKQLYEAYGVQVNCIAADLADETSIQFLISSILALKKPIDALINNAGSYIAADVHSEPDNALSQMLAINLISAVNITKGLLPLFLEQRHGHIFNMCSVANITPIPAAISYTVSKYALYGFTKCLREDLMTKGIKVTAVIPGSTLTASWQGTTFPAERFIQPEDVASAIYNAYSLSSGACMDEIIIRPQLGTL
jgi:short-subunit dehydrogenase